MRDARITQIYEGTNGIQALDLVGRKLPAHFGRYLRRFFHPVMAFLEQHQAEPELAEFVLPLAKAFARLQQTTLQSRSRACRIPTRRAPRRPTTCACSPWSRWPTSGPGWPRSRRPGWPRARDEAAFYRAKLATARFFMTKVLPESGALFAQIMAGSAPLMQFEDAAF